MAYNSGDITCLPITKNPSASPIVYHEEDEIKVGCMAL